jgi:hypothetical protein
MNNTAESAKTSPTDPTTKPGTADAAETADATDSTNATDTANATHSTARHHLIRRAHCIHLNLVSGLLCRSCS